MALSNSTDFTLSAGQLVEEARELCGIHADEEPTEAHEQVRGIRAMNMMLKEWQASGVMCWTLGEGTFTLIQGQAAYVMGAGGTFTTVPFDITEMRITRNNSSIPMHELSRDEYMALPNKITQGYPTQFYYQRARSGGTLYVWPTPDTALGTLNFTFRRVIMDMDNAASNIDLPQEWHQAIVYNLAVKLMPRYGFAGTPEFQLVMAEAKKSYDIVRDFDTAQGVGSISVMPAWMDPR